MKEKSLLTKKSLYAYLDVILLYFRINLQLRIGVEISIIQPLLNRRLKKGKKKKEGERKRKSY